MEWIKVEDKLPETGKTVLATVKYGPSKDGISSYHMVTARYYSEKDGSAFWMESEADEYEVGPVIAWMELPEPYIDEPGEFERKYDCWYLKGTVV